MTTASSRQGDLDAGSLRRVLGNFCSGVTIITAMHDGQPVGMTCQSFFAVSLDPPLVAFSTQCSSTSYPRIRSARQLAICILSEHQRHLGRQFALSGTDKFSGVTINQATNGAPIIEGSLAVLEAQIDQEYEAGDHFLVVARVTALDENSRHRPLLFFRSEFSALGERIL